MTDTWQKLRPGNIIGNLLGSLILAFGIYEIHSVSCVTEGGILGAVLLIERYLRISPSVSSLILTAICYFIGWRMLGRSFILYSVFACGGFSLFYRLLEMTPRLWPGMAEHPLTAALAGAVFVGVGAGLCVVSGGAPNGDDALAMSLKARFGIPLRRSYFISDLTVLLLSLCYIPLRRILYSLLTVILSGQIIDFMNRKMYKPQN